jgi:hypothetical protein
MAANKVNLKLVVRDLFRALYVDTLLAFFGRAGNVGQAKQAEFARLILTTPNSGRQNG